MMAKRKDNTTARRRPLLALAFVVAALANRGASAQSRPADTFESKLKVAYLVNIANFVTWPRTTGNTVLCARKNSHITPHLSALSDIRLGSGRKLDIDIDPDTLTRCDILYWDDASSEAGGNALLETRHRNLLIVGDKTSAAPGLLAIEFYVRNLKLRFYVNREVADKAGYKISSKLMRLSRETE